MADGRTPRYGAYDPEADLIDAYGTLPIVPTFVDPTLFGQEQRNPGFSMAAENPGVPVIMPTSVPTNPHREFKGVRFNDAPMRMGQFNPMSQAERRNPMAPNIPEGTSFTDERGMDPALIGAMLGGATPAFVGRGISRMANVPGAQRSADAATDMYARARAGERVVADPAYIPPRRFKQFSDDPYLPMSYMDDFPDKRMMKDVTRERTMMVPKPGRFTTRDERVVPELTRRTITHSPVQYDDFGNAYVVPRERAARHQSDRDFANRRMVEITKKAPEAFQQRVPSAYDKKFYQTGTARGAHSDNAVDILGMNREGALNRLVQSQAQNLRGEGIGSPATALMGTVLGGTLGEAYDETFGEGDTRYMDPSGEQRMAARQAGAKMPASAGRAIRKVLQDREQLSLEPQRNMDFPPEYQPRYMDGVVGLPEQSRGIETSPGLYQNLGQELPAVGPLFAFDPYQGY